MGAATSRSDRPILIVRAGPCGPGNAQSQRLFGWGAWPRTPPSSPRAPAWRDEKAAQTCLRDSFPMLFVLFETAFRSCEKPRDPMIRERCSREDDSNGNRGAFFVPPSVWDCRRDAHVLRPISKLRFVTQLSAKSWIDENSTPQNQDQCLSQTLRSPERSQFGDWPLRRVVRRRGVRQAAVPAVRGQRGSEARELLIRLYVIYIYI